MTTSVGLPAHVAPRNPLEARLARIWEEVLRPSATPIGMNDDFFDLGGESLHAFAVMGRVLRDFGVELSPRDLFECPSVGAMAAVIAERQRHQHGTPPLPVIESPAVVPPESRPRS
jgi:acyl carrier protein